MRCVVIHGVSRGLLWRVGHFIAQGLANKAWALATVEPRDDPSLEALGMGAESGFEVGSKRSSLGDTCSVF